MSFINDRKFIALVNGDHYWYDINMKPHKIVDMEDSYVENCIDFIIRRRMYSNRNYDLELMILRDELRRRISIRSTSIGKLVYG